jgi:hypothetical protein
MCITLQGAYSFLGGANTHDILGGNLDDNINLKTGFVSGETSRVNIYGEVSTVKFRFKPNELTLKLLLDDIGACFDINCQGSQVLLRSKVALRNNPECLNSGISSFASSSHFSGRLLRFDLQRRLSLRDLRRGDFVFSDKACSLPGQTLRRIVSIDRLSDNNLASKGAVFVISTREAHLTDAVSEGYFEFRTDNILTVNDIARKPNLGTRRWELASGQRSISLINLVRVHLLRCIPSCPVCFSVS